LGRHGVAKMQAYETIEYRGFNINVYYDEDARDPRQEFDHLGKMVCFHRNYILGDKHDYKTSSEAVYNILLELGYETEQMHVDIGNIEFIKKYWPKFEKLAIVLPLYLYDHSGITMSTRPFSCPWDSGQVGFIYLSRADARKEYGRLTKKNLQKIITYMTGEVREYDYFLTGQVYGYTIEPTDRNKEIDCDHSCWGFYGETDLSEAKSEIRYAIKNYKKETVTHVLMERIRKMELKKLFACSWAY